MKFIAFIEVCPENTKKIIKTQKKRITEKKTLKTLFPPHTIAKTSNGFLGFTIFESEDDSEIAEYVSAYTLAGGKMKVYPIWESSKGFEIWEKLI